MFSMIGGFMAFIIVAVVILVILSSCIRIVPQAQALVVERLGGYLGTYGVGIHFLIPFIDRVAKKVNLKEQVRAPPAAGDHKGQCLPCRSIQWYSSTLPIRKCMHMVWSVRSLLLRT